MLKIQLLSMLFFPFFSHAQLTETIVYPLKGQHASFGNFEGSLEIRPLGGVQVEVTRVVTYDTFTFEGRRVQQVWNAEGFLNGETLEVVFLLKQADIFQRVDGFSRAAEDFKASAPVAYSLRLTGGSTQVATKAGVESESIAGPARNAGAEHLWKNERRAFASYGESFPTVTEIANKTVFRPVIRMLEKEPFVQQYVHRPEYVSKNQYFVVDRTDFDFLRANPDFLRVDNKVMDPISLYESRLRADAYAPTLSQKQEIFEKGMRDHLNPQGYFSAASVDANDRIVDYLVSYDSALWTGMYAGTQAMRWLVTQDPEAMIYFRHTLRAMMFLMDVTGNPKEFARAVAKIKPGETIQEPWQQAPPPYQHLRYIKIGNNDMLQGLYYAFAWAYEILPADDALLAKVSEHATRMGRLRIATAKKVLSGNPFRTYGMVALGTGDIAPMKRFWATYNTTQRAKQWIGVDNGFYYGGIADWSGINLTTVSQISNILIAKNLMRKFPKYRSQLAPIVRGLRANLLETWAVYRNARRDYVTIAAVAFGAKNLGELGFAPETLPREWSHQDQFEGSVQTALGTLEEIPVPGVRHDTSVDMRLRPDWCLSAWPLRPWKYLIGEKNPNYFYQGAYSYPLFETVYTTSDNVWASSPFDFLRSENKNLTHGRMDYLHFYWMARLAKLLGPTD